MARDGQDLTWFEVAGPDSVVPLARARVEQNEVVLTCAGVAAPVQARFAWSEVATPKPAGDLAGPLRWWGSPSV